jgi:hypothetical protein
LFWQYMAENNSYNESQQDALFLKFIWSIIHLVGFHYKNISRCTVLWMSRKTENTFTWNSRIIVQLNLIKFEINSPQYMHCELIIWPILLVVCVWFYVLVNVKEMFYRMEDLYFLSQSVVFFLLL